MKLSTSSLSEEIRNAVIEWVDAQDERDGFEPNPDFDPDMEWLERVVTAYRKGINYRRRRNMKDDKILKSLKGLPEETRNQVLKQMGIDPKDFR